jgi:hypothetical protein
MVPNLHLQTSDLSDPKKGETIMATLASFNKARLVDGRLSEFLSVRFLVGANPQ